MAAAFRLYSELDTFYGQSGQLLAGGYLTFCEAGTTAPKDVFGEEALSTNNGSTVALGSSGRPAVDVWGSGAYFVELFDADDVKQGEADDVQIPGGEATALPALSAGKFLTNDGSIMSWAGVRQVPDPAGNASKVLGTDGTDLVWVSQPSAPPAPPDPEIVVSTTPNKSFQAGVSDDETKFYAQFGTGSAPATGAKGTSTNIDFPVEFAALWHVNVTPTISAATPSGALVDVSVTGSSATGFTANFNVSDDDNNSSWKISNTITFTWAAFGVLTVEAEE
jgi:hypothetical protein